jgi:sugar lactone lactonase YvrE
MKRACLLLTVLLAGACADRTVPEPKERLFVAAAVDTLWVRGSEADTVLEIPLGITADEEYVFVTDGARRGLAALNAKDGSTAWTAGYPGAGPGEFRRPAVIEVLPDGRIAVADTENGRLVFLDRSGKWLDQVPLEHAQVSGLCGLADGTIVMTVSTAEQNVVVANTDGTVRARVALPWESLLSQPPLARQAMLDGFPDRSACVLATNFGPGLAIHDGSTWRMQRDYIETLPPPKVETQEQGNSDRRVTTSSIAGATIASRGIAVDDDHLYVHFEGTTADRGRIIDVYSHEGRYQHSYRLDRRFRSLVVVGETMYMFSQIEGIPRLTALRVRRAE